MILFGLVYLTVGVAFPNPPAPNKTQFVWRVAAWLICAVAFAIHIGLEHFRLQNPPRKTGAYKSIEAVMKNQEDLVEVVAEIKQVVCVKG